MTLKSWLLKKLSGDDAAVLELSAEEEELSGLNLHEVLGAHMEWKKKLKNTLDGTGSEQYEASLVSQDNLCVLGKWLYGPGEKLYSHLVEYAALKKIHTEFHLCAGKVLTAHDTGDTKLASQILKGQFSDNSNQIQLDLVQLFSSVKNS